METNHWSWLLQYQQADPLRPELPAKVLLAYMTSFIAASALQKNERMNSMMRLVRE